MENYAVVETGGKQYLVHKDEIVSFELLDDVQKDGDVVFSNILVLGKEDGLKVGQPAVAGAQVKGKVLDFVKGKKINVFKKKRRKGYEKRIGHRQKYMKVQITEISG